MELMIPLKNQPGWPYYSQIYSYIKNEIVKGNLKPTVRLPSTRLLAEHLKVSRSTTQMAYEQLLSEGYIEAVPCRGYFVLKIDGLIDTGQEKMKSQPSFFIDTNKKSGKKEWAVDFSPRGIDLCSFPFNTWRRISKNTLIDDNREMFAAGDPQGELPFREAIRSYLQIRTPHPRTNARPPASCRFQNGRSPPELFCRPAQSQVYGGRWKPQCLRQDNISPSTPHSFHYSCPRPLGIKGYPQDISSFIITDIQIKNKVAV